MLEKLQLYGRNGWLIGLLFLMVFRVWFFGRFADDR